MPNKVDIKMTLYRCNGRLIEILLSVFVKYKIQQFKKKDTKIKKVGYNA